MTTELSASERRQRLERIGLTAAGVLLGAYLLLQAWSQIHDAYPVVQDWYHAQDPERLRNSDFVMFYAGSRLAVSKDRGQTYELNQMVRSILESAGYRDVPAQLNTHNRTNVWLRYYLAPFYLLAFAPLTALPTDTAYLVSIGLNLGLLALLGVELGCVLRWRRAETALLALAALAFSPVYATLETGQPTLLLAVLIGGAYLALRAGRSRVAAVLFAVMGLKPQWLGAGLSILKTRPGLMRPFAIACFVVLVLPFVVLGAGAIIDYVNLVTGRGAGDLHDPDLGRQVINWTGFFAALTGKPSTELWFMASAATSAVFMLLWWKGDTAVVLVGAVLTVLLVVPHTHVHEWVVLLSAAAILLSLDWRGVQRAGLVVGLLAVFLSVNHWSTENAHAIAGAKTVYWAPLAAAALLVWLTAITLLQTRSAGRRLVSLAEPAEDSGGERRAAPIIKV